jgi:hypothetical protein
MDKEIIISKLLHKYKGLKVNMNWGEVGLFYNPEDKLKKGIYLLTFKENDGENDKSSNLNRKDTFRLNLGISKKTFIKLFGYIPKRPLAGEIIDMDYDFTKKNIIMPHPIYAWMAWICVINPDEEKFKELLPLIDEGYNLAIEKYKKKKL